MYSVVPSGGYMWTISPNASASSNVFFVCGSSSTAGYLVLGSSALDSSYGVAPTLYLSSDITLSGEGTEASPYVIE